MANDTVAGTCPACGAQGLGRFCSQCGTPLLPSSGTARNALREEAVESIGFDRRLVATIRDLLLHPVRVVGVSMTGDRRQYLPPLKLFLALGGIYMLGLSLVQPFQFDPPSLRRMGVREQDALRIEQQLQKKGISVELFNERFEARMNTVVPVVTALALLPLVLLLRAFDRRRSWAEHFLFVAAASNGVWLYSLLLLPLAFVTPLHQLIVGVSLYIYFGIVFFALYPATTRLRTIGRFSLFALLDLGVSVVLSTAIFALVYVSVLLI